MHVYKYRCETRRRGETQFPQSIKSIGETLLRWYRGFSSAFISSSRGFSIPFVFPRSTIVLELSAPKLVLFLSHCPREDYREARERKSFEKQPRACCSFHLSLFSFCLCRSFNLLHRLPAGYQSSKSNNIISLRLPVRGPIPFPRAWRNPTVEFMADSVAVTPAVGLHKGVQGTYSHASTWV